MARMFTNTEPSNEMFSGMLHFNGEVLIGFGQWWPTKKVMQLDRFCETSLGCQARRLIFPAKFCSPPKNASDVFALSVDQQN